LIHEKNQVTKETGRFSNDKSPAAMFEKALKAFETGTLTFAELQLTLKLQLADGASPQELSRILQRRELIEPLSERAYQAVLGILQSEEDARGGNGAAAPVEKQSPAQRAVSRGSQADGDSDEPAMSRLLQALAADWDPESGKGAAAPLDINPLSADIHTLRAELDQREDDLEAMRNEHARVLGLLEARARTAAQFEAEVRAHAAELNAVRDALQLQQDNNRALKEELARSIAASEAAEQRVAEFAARSEEALRSAESYKADWTGMQESLAAHDDALNETRRLLEETEAALRMAQRSLDERDSTLAQARYSLSEHDTALDQARQLLSDRDAALQESQQLLKDRDAALQEAQQLLSDRDAALREAQQLLRDRDDAVEQLQRRLGQRDEALDQARQLLIESEDELDQARRLLNEREAQIASLIQEHAAIAQTGAPQVPAAANLHADLQAALDRGAALEADLITVHDALDAEQGKSRRLEILLAEKNSELAEKSAIIADAGALEVQLDEAYHRINDLTHELALRAPPATHEDEPRALPATAAPQEHSVQISEFTRQAHFKPKAGIPNLQLPPELAWLRRRSVLTFGMYVLAAALIAVIWLTTHHKAPAKVAAAVPAQSEPLPGTVIQDCEACPALTVLPKGRFKQGSAEASATSAVKPMHWVAIAQPFAMAINDVTVAQFGAFVAATGRNMQGCDVYDGQWKHQQNNSWQNPGFEQSANHPVTCVSWNDANAYAQWLSAQVGHHYRLPSASEWEYAARAGSNGAQPWSGNGADACLNANVADSSALRRYPGWIAFGCSDGFVYTSPVGSFKANLFGLHDMLGNVFQWTEDCWNANYTHAPIDGSARSDGNCAEHELRGGSWFSSPEFVRADYRNHFAEDYRASSIGIRLVRDLSP
jgi:formylglycine-generating enzyme required for sulfatase activity